MRKDSCYFFLVLLVFFRIKHMISLIIKRYDINAFN